MNQDNRTYLALTATGILSFLNGTAGAQTIFTEDFNSITGLGLNGGPVGQVTTTHDLGFGGSLAGWGKSGAGSIHAVDTANTWPGPTANPQNWGVMIWQDNVITQSAGIAGSNDSGVDYHIDFLGAGAVYEAAGQVNNGTTDGLRIEVLRASDSAVLHTFDQVVAQPIGVGDLGLTPYSFTYTGDGSGDILFRVGPVNAGQGRFQGTIDELELSVVPIGAINITSFTATPDTLADSEDAVTFDWTVTGMPLDSLQITPGNIDVLDDTVETGGGTYDLDPGPDGTTQYTLTAMRGGDTVTRKVTVTLPAPEITSFTASPSPVAPSENVTLSWQVGLPATTLTIDPGGIDVSGDTDGTGAGSIIVNPTKTSTYTLTATRGTSTSTANAVAIVQTPPNPNALSYESFDGITGMDLNGGPNGQVTTTHDVGVFGTLAGWSNAGAGTIHAVDTHNIWTGGVVSSNPPNWGIMIWQDNVITQTAGTPGSNESGVGYSIDFLAAGAVYEQAGQVNDGTTDGLRIEVLRASDDAVLHTFDHITAPPVGLGNLGLLPGNFTYTGDGSGDIKLRVGPMNAGQGRFQGTIDDLQLTLAGSVSGPEITSITEIGEGVFELTLLGAANTGYEFRSSTILDFNPGILAENLTAGDPAMGTIGGFNDSVLTTDSSGRGTAQLILVEPKNFVMAIESMP
jgi:hypothetical protein